MKELEEQEERSRQGGRWKKKRIEYTRECVFSSQSKTAPQVVTTF
jgi:hypothetical protein